MTAARSKPLTFKGTSKNIEFEYIESGELMIEISTKEGDFYVYLSPQETQKLKEWLG